MISTNKSRAKAAAKQSRATRRDSDDRGGQVSGTAIGLGAAAAAAVASAVFNITRARRAERDNPMRGELIRIDGVDLHCVDSGTPGPTIVLLHGNAVTLEDWFASGVFQDLSKTNRVIAFDRPGFGYSSRPRTRLWTPAAQADLLALAIKSLGATDATVVCHSFGTLVGLELAIRHGDLVEKLVLMSGYYYPSARLDVIPASVPAIPLVGDVERYTAGPIIGSAMQSVVERKIFAPAPVASSWERFPFEMTLRPSQMRAEAAEAALMVPSAASLSRRYSELTVPVHIVSGEGDEIVDHHGQSERLASELASATVTSIPGVGHMVHHSAKDRVLQAIRRTVAR